MTQRLATILLAASCLVLSVYLVLASLISGVGQEQEWEGAARAYVEEYHKWLSESPGSGWARVEALAAGAELSRIERLRGDLRERSGWRYAGGDFRTLLQAGGKALVEATYWLEGSGEKRGAQELYILEKTLQGIKVIDVMGGAGDDQR